jgi:hypothetical protein
LNFLMKRCDFLAADRALRRPDWKEVPHVERSTRLRQGVETLGVSCLHWLPLHRFTDALSLDTTTAGTGHGTV